MKHKFTFNGGVHAIVMITLSQIMLGCTSNNCDNPTISIAPDSLWKQMTQSEIKFRTWNLDTITLKLFTHSDSSYSSSYCISDCNNSELKSCNQAYTASASYNIYICPGVFEIGLRTSIKGAYVGSGQISTRPTSATANIEFKYNSTWYPLYHHDMTNKNNSGIKYDGWYQTKSSITIGSKKFTNVKSLLVGGGDWECYFSDNQLIQISSTKNTEYFVLIQ